tara:strand:- start:511 stop:732 length:222 start_codon:yes stop_codon:yes gene_type:complete
MKLSTAINKSSNIKAHVVVGDKSCYVKVSRASARELVSDYLDSTWDGESYYDESGTSIATVLTGETYNHLYIG